VTSILAARGWDVDPALSETSMGPFPSNQIPPLPLDNQPSCPALNFPVPCSLSNIDITQKPHYNTHIPTQFLSLGTTTHLSATKNGLPLFLHFIIYPSKNHNPQHNAQRHTTPRSAKMPITHIVLFQFKAEVSTERIEDVCSPRTRFFPFFSPLVGSIMFDETFWNDTKPREKYGLIINYV
jgi:hypothetical protein